MWVHRSTNFVKINKCIPLNIKKKTLLAIADANLVILSDGTQTKKSLDNYLKPHLEYITCHLKQIFVV